jgi:hypothetical protein
MAEMDGVSRMRVVRIAGQAMTIDWKRLFKSGFKGEFYMPKKL